jgi:Asp-tRNA(Asn)/Glu-tRNA(Gln) amidotransferase A subunit family amidase
MDTASLAQRIAAKELSPVEPVDAVLDWQHRLDPTLQLFTTVMPDQLGVDGQQHGRAADIAARREVRPLVGVLTGESLIYTKGDPHGVQSHA